MKWIYGINFGAIHNFFLSEWRNEKICRSGKSQGHMDHRKVKGKIIQAFFMINLYVINLYVHSSYAKQVIMLKMSERRTDGRTRLVTQ